MTKLPLSDLVFERHKNLLQPAIKPVTKKKSLVSAQILSDNFIEVDKKDFMVSCENFTARPTFTSFFLGLLYPFHYKLYKEMFAGFCIMFILLLSYNRFFFFLTPSAFNFIVIGGVYSFFALYTKTLWHRNIYRYLVYRQPEITTKSFNGVENIGQPSQNAAQRVKRHAFLFKFSPHGTVLTAILGTAYLIGVMYLLLTVVSFLYVYIM